MKPRRKSHSTWESASRDSRRRMVLASGIKKSAPNRRLTTGGVIGDRVYLPGSPVMTLPELLHEAEVGLEGGPRDVLAASGRDPFKTPLPRRLLPPLPSSMPAIQRNVSSIPSTEQLWTKDDWKKLDACFTDERLLAGSRLGLKDDVLADVDEVQPENVLNRFVELMGGEEANGQRGDAWTR